MRSVHIPAAAQIHAASFAAEAWGDSVLAQVLELPGSFGRAALVESGGCERLTGFTLIRVAADEAELLTLCIAPAYRQRGIGSDLLRDFVEQSILRGGATAYLEVAEDNHAAYSLYRRFGFDTAGYRPDYYQRSRDCRVGARLLRRRLAPTGEETG